MPVPRRRTVSEDTDTITRTAARDEDESPKAPRARVREEITPNPYVEGDGSVYETEDEDEVPSNAGIIQEGKAGARKLRQEGSAFANDFKFSDSAQLVKFLARGPYASYNQHWLNERDGKKSFVCIGKGCPLCAIGDPGRRKIFLYSVALIEGGDVVLQSLSCGVRLFEDIDGKDNDPMLGPITKGYWALSKKGSGLKTVHSVNRVSPHDLADPWGVDEDVILPELEKLVPYDKSIVRMSTRAELREVADELS